jgi:ketosteroid isomerase-like protein
MKSFLPAYALAVVLTASANETPGPDTLADEVRAAEQAFARSMAQRDLRAFTALIDEEAVFFGDKVLRGREAVVAGWKGFFEGPKAPFSWEPAQVEVLDSGTLGISSGPVRNPDGKQIGVFNSIWRRGADGKWKVIFDKGCPPCNCRR